MDPKNLSQADLAQFMGVDRTTIRAWTVLGMPYKKPAAKGAKAGFCSSICIHWKIGHRITESRRGDFSPLQKVAIGWYSGFRDSHLTGEDESAFLEMMGAAGLNRESAFRQLEFARGYWSLMA